MAGEVGTGRQNSLQGPGCVEGMQIEIILFFNASTMGRLKDFVPI